MIDFHTHCYPDNLAEQAMETLSNMFPTDSLGNRQDLLLNMAHNQVDQAVVLHVAARPKTVKAVNRFAIEINSPQLISFCSVHPDSPSVMEDLEMLKAAGIKGIKLHPNFQAFNMTDQKYRPFYRKMSDLGFITLFHSGLVPDYGELNPMPSKFMKIIDCFPDSPVVIAHMGGTHISQEEVVLLKELKKYDLYVDTAASSELVPVGNFLRVLEIMGTDRVLYGSDYPWCSQRNNQNYLRQLELTKEELDRILDGNARKLLKLQD